MLEALKGDGADAEGIEDDGERYARRKVKGVFTYSLLRKGNSKILRDISREQGAHEGRLKPSHCSAGTAVVLPSLVSQPFLATLLQSASAP